MRAFLNDNTSKGLSEHTNRFYKDHLHVFNKFVTEIMHENTPIRLNKRHIEAFIDYRINTLSKSRNGCNVSLRALKRYSSFLVEKGYADSSPFDNYTFAKDKKTIIETFDELQINKMLSLCDLNTFVGYRDYVLILFMLDTGIRLRELCDINVNDVVFNDNYVRVFGKNQMYRNVPLSRTLKDALKKYVKVCGYSNSDRLFISQNDTGLRPRSVQGRLERYGKMAGINNVRVSPHTFRHTFAKMYVQNGGNVFVLQDILGHSTLEMVREYVRLFSKDLQKDHARHSPLSRL